VKPAVAAVILAAGRGARFGAGAKVVAELDRKPLVRHVAEAALASHAHPVLVVVGQVAEKTAAALAGLDVQLVCGAGFETAMSRSLKAGIAAVPPSAPGALVLLADMPRISASLINRLIDAFEASAHPDAVVPVHAGRRGNPVLLGRTIFEAVRSLEGDDGARLILAAGVVELPVEDAAVTADVDTSEDLLRLGKDSRR
jgi:molybdenum cofactor cytidylyltransferase